MPSAAVQIALGITGVSTVLGGLGRVSAALGGVARGGAAALGSAAILGGAAAAGAAIGGLGVVVGKTGTDFLALKEQALTAFTTMLGGASQGTAFFNQLQTFAANTNFELPGLLKTSQFLLALGFQAKDVIPDLTAIGNAIASTGGGQANIDRVTLALGQMKAKGKVQGDEMLQLTENNINAWQYLATFLKTDVPTAMKMVTKGLVTGEQGVNAIIQGLAKDPKFAGMMEKQSHTFNGLVSNMHDYWTQFTGVIMTPVFDRVLKPGLQWVTNWLAGPGLSTAQRFATGLDAGITRVAGTFRSIMGLVGNFREVLAGGTGGGTVGGSLATGFLLIRDSITNRVIPALRLLWRTVTGGTAGIDRMSVLQRVILGVARGVEFVARIFQLGIDSVLTFRQALAGDWFKNGAGNAFVNMVGRIGLAFRDLGQAFRQSGFGGALRQLWTGYLQPALTDAWNSLRTWITDTAIPRVAVWLDGLRTRFAEWVGPAATTLAVRLAGWLSAFGVWLTGTAIPTVGKWVDGLKTRFVGWVRESLPPLMAQLAAWLTGLVAWVQATAVPALDRATAWLANTLGGWVRDKAVPVLMANLPGWLSTLTTWLVGANFVLGTVTDRLAETLGGWAGRAAVELASGGMERWWGVIWTTLGLGLLSAATMTIRLGIALGTGLGKGIVAGLNAHFPNFLKTLNGWIDLLPDKLKEWMGVKPAFIGPVAPAPGQNNGPGSSPRPGPAPDYGPINTPGGAGGGKAGLAPGAAGMFAGATFNFYNTSNGLTYEEAGRDMANAMYKELDGLLQSGGGMAV